MFDSIQRELDNCQLRDRFRLQKNLDGLQRKSVSGSSNAKAIAAELEKLQVTIEKSQAACKPRIAAIPSQINFPDNLPVSERADDICRMLQQHQVLIVAGDTGSGKTTQLPKICLKAGLGRLGLIGHTQPRRLAAVSVANRIAEELGTATGAGVGYQVRFNEKVSESSFLKLMTDGILLAEIQSDRFLNNYEAIIIDEAHERSLNIDFLLGFLKQLLPLRKDLKLIITSATIDVEKFSAHFDDAPIIAVSGRTYPVETRYLPLIADASSPSEDPDQHSGILQAIEDIERFDREAKRASGDILVFLSGEREIRDTANFLRKQKIKDLEILPLYARLGHAEQVRIFQPHRGRRVVLATNVAETSLTVPGINYVIDPGFARISRYNLQSKVQRLPIEPVSQASANQRKGRCGRLANGVCIRLYSEEDFLSRPLFTDPEIRRTNLASVILRMKHLRLGNADDFPFLEPPEQKAINEGTKLLIELNALSPTHELTQSGRQMAALPVDPKLARMLIAANSLRCLTETLIIVSSLSAQDPREITHENRQKAQQKLAPFNHPESDFLCLVNLWNNYEKQRQDLSQGQLRKYCKTHYLSFMRMREWRELHRQLLLSCQQLGMRLNREPANYQSIHQSIITGSLNQIACLDERKTYMGSRNRKFSLFASSVLAAKPPKWIVTGEQIETSGTFATMAAKIEPEWVEQAAIHLVKREYFEPHWSKKRQEVMAYQKVQLYGLVLIEKALVGFSAIDAVASHQLFINEGLAMDQVETKLPFLRHNREFVAKLVKQEEKLRRPDIIVSDREIGSFYGSRIPDTICSTRQLQQWFPQASKNQPQLLQMTEESLLGSGDALNRLHDYPDSMPVQRNRLNIEYAFAPGEARDGATLEVPLAVLNQLTQADVDWAVPGILREKCISLIKGLPKTQRKNFIPVSGFVDETLSLLNPQDGELVDALLAQMQQRKGVKISKQELLQVTLPDHLQVKIRVMDGQGKEIDFGADISELRQRHAAGSAGSRQPNHGAEVGHDLEVTGITDWVCEALPTQVEIGDDLVLLRYPALVDDLDTASVRLFDSEAAATLSHQQGLIRLFMLKSVQQRNMLKKQFTRFINTQALKLPPEHRNLDEQAIAASYASAFQIGDVQIRDKPAFEACLARGKARIISCGDNIEKLLSQVLDTRFNIRRQLQGLKISNLAYMTDDIERQLDGLLHEQFLQEAGLVWLKEYPRYLAAIESRLEKAPHVGEKDEQYTKELAQYWQRYLDAKKQFLQVDKTELQLLRWMIEELRVSLFAQSLGTRIPISTKRLEKQFSKLQ